MNQDQIVAAIAGLNLFADLGRPQLEAVADTLTEESFPPGRRIQRQGFAGTGFHVILDGEAEWHIDGRPVDDAGEVAARPINLKRGDWFGELSILFDEPPMADVVARTQLNCITLPAPDFEGFLFAHPKVMYRMLLGEARRVSDPERWHR